VQLTFPWPDRRLNPNARIHRMELAKLKKAAREDAAWVVMQQTTQAGRAKVGGNGGPVLLDITFHPPDKRRRDLDNMLASCKATLDGLADALKIDDQRFEIAMRRADPVKLGAVVVTLALCAV